MYYYVDNDAIENVPQLSAVFSYTVDTIKKGDTTEEGYIRVYLAKIGFEKIAITTFDDTHREFTYSIQTLSVEPTRHVNEIYGMIEEAEKEFSNPFIQNPFTQLLHDNEAMSQLLIIVEKFIESE